MAGHAALFAQLKARKPKLTPKPELQRTFEVFGKQLVIQEDPDGGVGGSVWEAATSLLRCIESQVQLFPEGHFNGKRILELGSGTGLGGLSVALLGAEVTLTDRKEVVDLLSLNAELNKDVLAGSVSAKELEWGTDVSSFLENQRPIDYLLVSECIYNLKYGDVLLESMVALSSPTTVTLFSYAVRNPEQEELYFQDKVASYFDIESLPLPSTASGESQTPTSGKKPQEHRLLRLRRKTTS